MPDRPYVQTLTPFDARTRAVYASLLREHGGPGVRSDEAGCKLYDFVQQRQRSYLSQPRGCCEPPASSPAPTDGQCMAGKRLLVGVPSYGNDARTWSLLAIVLASLDHARRTGVDVEVGLDLTDPLPPGFRLPDGLRVTQWRHSAAVKLALCGMYRQRFWAASAAGAHDYYMMIDNDVNASRENLEALCVQSHALSGTNLMPGLLRYETLTDEASATRYLLDHMLRSPPHISYVLSHGGAEYVAAHNPMQGSFFLPAQRMACVLRKSEACGGHGADFRAFHSNGSLEYYESLWLMPWFATVVPLQPEVAQRHFVHHLTDKYTRRSDVTMATPAAFFRAAANFSRERGGGARNLRPITLLGARRRRPQKKLEVELRERQAGTPHNLWELS